MVSEHHIVSTSRAPHIEARPADSEISRNPAGRLVWTAPPTVHDHSDLGARPQAATPKRRRARGSGASSPCNVRCSRMISSTDPTTHVTPRLREDK